ncbi:putative metalloprotease CJM1_0395 family protein [Colwelliaceae bacterium 6471]
MNIAPQTSFTPVATVVNPQTDSLRRENNAREVITQPAATSQSAAEKGVASDKDKAKTPAQNNEAVDFANIRKQAEKDDTTIGDASEQEGESSSDAQQQKQSGQPKNVDSVAEELELSTLKKRDREVRAHEQAHSSVGGSLTGAPSYSYEQGPDGNKYAVSGEVDVDLSIVEGDPQATINKMQKVYAAALAPADPSIQDKLVAATASKAILEAQSDILNERVSQADPATKRDVLDEEGEEASKTNASDSDYDALVKKTLEEQERIAPERSVDVIERALRIENLYSNITQAYEKPPSYQFQLTA